MARMSLTVILRETTSLFASYMPSRLPVLMLGLREPDFLSRRSAQMYSSLADEQRNRSIIVPCFDLDTRARLKPLLIEKFQEFPVTFIDARDHVFRVRFRLAKQTHA